MSGGGLIDLGAFSDLVVNAGLISVLGGTNPSGSYAAGGLVDVFGSFSNSGAIRGRLIQTSGFSTDQYAPWGGGGGAGAGGDGQLIPEPATTTLLGVGLVLVAGLIRHKKSQVQ